MDKIERPILNKSTPEENIALIDTWIADTADKLNYLIERISKDGTDSKD